jgi:membrane protein required for colicin V production
MSMLPDDPESTILKRLRRPKGGEPEPQEPPQEQRSQNRPADPEGYRRSDRAGMQQLIQGSAKAR